MATQSVLLLGESQGRGSLAGCRLWGRTESDTTEVTQQQQQSHTFNKPWDQDLEARSPSPGSRPLTAVLRCLSLAPCPGCVGESMCAHPSALGDVGPAVLE